MTPEDPAAAESRSAPPAEWRALVRLRDRVEAAAAEIERLRAENAALAGRLLELQESRAQPNGPALPLPGEPAELRARIEGFIAAIDAVLREDAQATRSDASS
ncbi:MAG: hypothetical protein ACK41D_07705 [Rubricoccaceae bacterium]